MDRTNSVLTDKQREFLQTPAGEREEQYSKQMMSYHWRNIRSRIWAALRDLEFLAENLTADERRMMLDVVEKDKPLTQAGDSEIDYSAKHLFPGALAFFYQYSDNSQEFSELIEKGVEHATEQEGWFADVNVDVTVDRTHRVNDIEDLSEAEALLEGEIPESMTREEFIQMASMLRKADLITNRGYMRLKIISDEHNFPREE